MHTSFMSRLGLTLLLLAGAGLRESPAMSARANVAGTNQMPSRVASVSLASDTVLLRLLGPERLCAVSWVVDWPEYSPHTGTVPERIPRLSGDPEGVIALEPELAIIADHSGIGLADLLRAAGIETLELAQPRSLTAVINDVDKIGKRVGKAAEARQWSADLRARVTAVEAHAARRRQWRALIVDSGSAEGRGTLADDLLQRLNTRNLARETSLQGSVVLDAERLLSWQPEVVFVAVAGAAVVPDARAELTHVAGYELLQHSQDWAPLRVVGISRRELGAVSPLAVDALVSMDRVLEELSR